MTVSMDDGLAEARGPGGAAARKSSFYWAMRLMPVERRHGMYRLYDFCRVVDDIADGALPAKRKLTLLQAWRADVAALEAGRTAPTGLPEQNDAIALLAPLLAQFPVQVEDLIAIVDGCIMDADSPPHAPDSDRLMLYCDRVAGAVGRASLPIFGVNRDQGRAFADTLGRALQLTNILRDLREDATRGRVYMPRELLTQAGINADLPATAIIDHPRLPIAAQILSREAEASYLRALALMPRDAKARLRPAIVMLAVYRRLLARMTAKGFTDLDRRARLPRVEKLWLALRHGLPGLLGR